MDKIGCLYIHIYKKLNDYFNKSNIVERKEVERMIGNFRIPKVITKLIIHEMVQYRFFDVCGKHEQYIIIRKTKFLKLAENSSRLHHYVGTW